MPFTIMRGSIHGTTPIEVKPSKDFLKYDILWDLFIASERYPFLTLTWAIRIPFEELFKETILQRKTVLAEKILEEIPELDLNKGGKDEYETKSPSWLAILQEENAEYKGYSPLALSILTENQEMTRILLERGASLNATINEFGNTALIYAARFEKTDHMEKLLHYRPDVNAQEYRGFTALMFLIFAREESVPAIEMLLDAGADVNIEAGTGGTALTFAATKKNPLVIQLLLSKGADINHRDKEGRTPLMCAADQGSEEVVSVLIEMGADVYLVDYHGGNALMYAAARIGDGEDKILELLISAGIDIDAVDVMGESALMYAVRGNFWAVQELILAGANVNLVSKKLGKTALVYAISCQNVDLVRYLCANKASVNKVDRDKKTPLHYAVDVGQVEIVDILLESGADPTFSGARVDVLTYSRGAYSGAFGKKKERQRQILDRLQKSIDVE